MKIIDSHAHLMDEMYKYDVKDVIKRCVENDVECIVNIGYDKESSIEAIKIANEYDWMYATIGMHPDECHEENLELDFLKDLAKDKKVVAIGEIGLDYHYDFENKNEAILNEKKHFVRQIQLANELSLPVVIHSRDADMDMLKVLKENTIKKGFVMHCFSSSAEIAKEVLRIGGYISFAGTVTFKNARNLIEVAKMIPLDKLLVETDSPYLTPEPYRGKRNEPWHVWETSKKIAEIKEMSLEELVISVNQNIRSFYNI